MRAPPTTPKRVDSQYTRNGTCALFVLFEPLAAKRHVLVKERHAALDYADAVRFLRDEVHSDADKIVLVRDNLQHHIQLWQNRRNQTTTRVQWHFTTKDARIKLHQLYSQLLHS